MSDRIVSYTPSTSIGARNSASASEKSPALLPTTSKPSAAGFRRFAFGLDICRHAIASSKASTSSKQLSISSSISSSNVRFLLEIPADNDLDMRLPGEDTTVACEMLNAGTVSIRSSSSVCMFAGADEGGTFSCCAQLPMLCSPQKGMSSRVFVLAYDRLVDAVTVAGAVLGNERSSVPSVLCVL